MNEAAYRILDILSRRLGSPISINEITKNIDEIHGKAHYADIHEKIKDLDREGIVTLAKSGRSSLVSLNFDNYMIIDMLAEMELKRKQDFLKGRQEMQMLMLEIDTCLHSIPLVSYILLMYPEKNAKLNKAEMLICLKESDDKQAVEETKIGVHAIAETLQQMHNTRIDYLTLESKMFLDLLKSTESNTIRETLHNKIAILHPQDFWLGIKNATEKGVKMSAIEHETNPAKISEEDLVFNLARFGYAEIGPTVKQGKLFCIEYVIASIMFHDDARRIDAIPVIIAKNPKISYDLLLFLARKYGFGGKILGILRTLRNLVAHGMKTVDEPIRLLEAMKTEEIKANTKSIKEKLRLYNVT
ncbi:hypothetical protein [Nitrosopumilus ureiphilus]|uniref:Uncharacterized protein n=1 Tax=Nitrosopumilus ureiphilus TaxID=1470067 RepID=A0A7D5MAT0_9ARCH|nr:hypothetical protein [Nitrosopumilus ureiphilus]QLH07169.1 hypothetical protein C5F50_08835 [Nitrosopumilus ureiphilus]